MSLAQSKNPSLGAAEHVSVEAKAAEHVAVETDAAELAAGENAAEHVAVEADAAELAAERANVKRSAVLAVAVIRKGHDDAAAESAHPNVVGVVDVRVNIEL